MTDLELTLAALRPRLQNFLPGDLIARLDAELAFADGSEQPLETLLEARETLHSLKRNLGTYLPQSLVSSKPTPGVPRAEFVSGTVLFADVTGFTSLAERQRVMGEEGAEHLNRMINDLFAALLNPLSRLGGELLIFAGDALQAFFPARDGAQDAISATRAAVLMIRAIAHFDQGPTPLTASVGLARGDFFAAQVGTSQRMEYLVTGGPIQQSMKAEAKALPRQVSLAPGLAACLVDHFRLAHIADGYHAVIDDLGDQLADLDFDPLPGPQQKLGENDSDCDPSTLVPVLHTILSDLETLSPFFPPNVLRRIVAFQRDGLFPGEHRLVAVMFVNLRGFEELVEALGPEQTPRLTYWINRYFVEAQETLAGCGGLVTHVDPYDQGFTLLCPFGAPLADEDTPHRATAAALRLNEKLHLLNHDLAQDLLEQALPQDATCKDEVSESGLLSHHIGITFGPIYTGQVGQAERREYVVVGDNVNLSARLMSKAQPNQILISGWVYDRVRQTFACHPLEPMKLKGKAKAVRVFAVERRVPASAWLREAAVGPLIGREEELATLEKALNALENGHGGVLTLAGETGIGKTRLIAELAQRARYWHILVLTGRCLSYAQTNPYTPWIEALWRWFELDTAADNSERRVRVAQALELRGLGHLADTLVALLGFQQNAVISTERPASTGLENHLEPHSSRQEWTAQLDSPHSEVHLGELDPDPASDLIALWEQLGQKTPSDQALLSLLQEISRQDQPVLFIVEDLQWVDRASWMPLVNLARSTARYPILLLVTMRHGRTEERWQSAIEDHTEVARVVLRRLSRADTAALATRIIMARETAPELVSWLHHRAQGNPLFASQLLYALAGSDSLHIDPGTGCATLSKSLPNLPLTVREIMLSRVDQLSEETRTVVKCAAVIGDPVAWEILVHLAHEALACSKTQLVDRLQELSARLLLSPAPPASEYTFVHPLLQEAVYSSIPYAQRRRWHRIIADFLAQEVKVMHQHFEALAYHYKNSDTPALSVRYSRLAGDHARARQAWEEALDYFQASIDIMDGSPSSNDERFLALEGRGDVFALTERYAEAASAYQDALACRAVGAEASDTGHLEGKLGLIYPLLDKVDEAISHLALAWDTLDRSAPLRAWVAAALGWIVLRARPRDMTAIAGAGSEAVAWWRQGQRVALSATAQMALKEMMAGRVPPNYERLVQLALEDREETKAS